MTKEELKKQIADYYEGYSAEYLKTMSAGLLSNFRAEIKELLNEVIEESEAIR